MGKKLKTANLSSKFTDSKKEECTSTCSLLKIFETLRSKVNVSNMSVLTNNLKGTLRHLKKL